MMLFFVSLLFEQMLINLNKAQGKDLNISFEVKEVKFEKKHAFSY